MYYNNLCKSLVDCNLVVHKCEVCLKHFFALIYLQLHIILLSAAATPTPQNSPLRRISLSVIGLLSGTLVSYTTVHYGASAECRSSASLNTASWHFSEPDRCLCNGQVRQGGYSIPKRKDNKVPSRKSNVSNWKWNKINQDWRGKKIHNATGSLWSWDQQGKLQALDLLTPGNIFMQVHTF